MCRELSRCLFIELLFKCLVSPLVRIRSAGPVRILVTTSEEAKGSKLENGLINSHSDVVNTSLPVIV